MRGESWSVSGASSPPRCCRSSWRPNQPLQPAHRKILRRALALPIPTPRQVPAVRTSSPPGQPEQRPSPRPSVPTPDMPRAGGTLSWSLPGPGHWVYLAREYGGSVRIKKDFFLIFSKNLSSASTRTPPSSGLTYAR